ncbi:DUF7230 family protein [Pseudaquidulcibacter saccharophilus]|uniref:DUF7230 family protein n=1 Tax=Pseudaquidulcibacter saccharophilus TaxID=2831900 RepID=UPI003B82EA2B
MEAKLKRNPIAKSLRSPHLRLQVVKNKKTYSRKIKHKKGGFEKSSAAFFICSFI